MVCQWRFINCYECARLVGDGGTWVGGGCGCVGTEALWESSVLSAQFCHEPKNALKNEVYKKKLSTEKNDVIKPLPH